MLLYMQRSFQSKKEGIHSDFPVIYLRKIDISKTTSTDFRIIKDKQ